MLVMSRRAGDSIMIGDSVTVTVNRIDGNKVSIGVTAPIEVSVIRAELAERVDDDTIHTEPTPMFVTTHCSQCGKSFGPGDHGYSHCSSHAGERAIDDV